MFSDEIVSCFKDPAELVLFHDVEMKGIFGKGASNWKLVRVFQDRHFLLEKSGHLPFVKEQKHFDVVTTLSKGNKANW
jgi:hypothetical protein